MQQMFLFGPADHPSSFNLLFICMIYIAVYLTEGKEEGDKMCVPHFPMQHIFILLTI